LLCAALVAGGLGLLACDDEWMDLPLLPQMHWWGGFDADGMNDYVYALTQYEGQLVAGGVFRYAGAVAAPGIARWDGRAWYPLGSGLLRDDCTATPDCHASVRALAVMGGDLIAGGRFTSGGGVAVQNIARWDGNGWSPFGEGLGGTVFAVASYQGQLVAGGEFTHSGTDSTVRNLALWDGTRWSAVGGGPNSSVRALLADGADLYAGGDFTMAGADSIAYIARWDGQRWEAMAGGVDGPVLALASYASRIAVTGSFTHVGDLYHHGNVALWDGRFWDSIQSYFWAPASLGIYAGDLVVGGSPHFHYPQFNGAGRWTGREWRSFANGIRGTVNAVCAVDGHLYLGGYFTAAGDYPSRYIARWDDVTPSP
jgi:hypothetical protein